MGTVTLTDKLVKDTYKGVLHAQGESLPSTGTVDVYDGGGQQSSLSLGLSGNGGAISGGFSISRQLSAGELKYTETDSLSGAYFPLISDGNKSVVFGQMTSRALIDLVPSPAGTYSSVENITVNSKGLVTNITGGNNLISWAKFNGQDRQCTYTSTSLVVSCVLFGSTIEAGQIITVKNATESDLNGTYVVQTSSGNEFTFANRTGSVLQGSLTIDIVIVASYNIEKVEKVGSGLFKLTFNTKYNNPYYVTNCGATVDTSTNVDGLRANVKSQDKDYVIIRAFY